MHAALHHEGPIRNCCLFPSLTLLVLRLGILSIVVKRAPLHIFIHFERVRKELEELYCLPMLTSCQNPLK